MTTVMFDRVSKQFTLHHERPRSFQELFLNVLHLKGTPTKEKYWALRDVSFEVEQGEMLGIIGANGAGKSTLLKLMSRIIEPTSGEISVNGRVSALLELGSGFHPDLTGRENIYLNGSIIGFSRAEMDRIFDDIVAFSEMERFVDVPVKHYSSGMYMRLGFSVAIHVQPDILLVDEVLAVGDQAFQQQCLDRINEMKRDGVTILLVTHSLGNVREMCDRALWLDGGQIQDDGPVEQVLEKYMGQVRAADKEALERAEAIRRRQQQVAAAAERSKAARPLGPGTPARIAAPGQKATANRLQARRWGTGEGEIARVQFLDGEGQEQRSFETGETFVVRIHFAAQERIERPQFGLALYHAGGFHISGPNTTFSGLEIDAIEGEGYIDYVIERLPLLEGTYLVSVSLGDYEGTHPYDYQHLAYTFRVRPNDAIQEKFGSFLIPSSWQMGPTGLYSVSEATGDRA
jgi:ABC-type polysaccharide/polyol phosphate transport system ATPase subunit